MEEKGIEAQICTEVESSPSDVAIVEGVWAIDNPSSVQKNKVKCVAKAAVS